LLIYKDTSVFKLREFMWLLYWHHFAVTSPLPRRGHSCHFPLLSVRTVNMRNLTWRGSSRTQQMEVVFT